MKAASCFILLYILSYCYLFLKLFRYMSEFPSKTRMTLNFFLYSLFWVNSSLIVSISLNAFLYLVLSSAHLIVFYLFSALYVFKIFLIHLLFYLWFFVLILVTLLYLQRSLLISKSFSMCFVIFILSRVWFFSDYWVTVCLCCVCVWV